MKHDIDEMREYAKDHTIHECADKYCMEINSMYTYFNQHHIAYKRLIKSKRKGYERIISDDSFNIAQSFGKLQCITERDGIYILALGVLAYARIDNDEDFPTKDLFISIIEQRFSEMQETNRKIRVACRARS
jgi:hypothetical protein